MTAVEEVDLFSITIYYQLLLYFVVFMSIRQLIARFESQENETVKPKVGCKTSIVLHVRAQGYTGLAKRWVY